MITKKYTKLALLVGMLFFILLVTGCARGRYYAVVSKFAQSDSDTAPPDVTITDVYNKEIKNQKLIVALRAPDTCLDAGASGMKGDASRHQEVMHTACGVEMAQLEKALVRKGFRVSSWKAVNNISKHNSDITPLMAAKQLGASVMLEINSLEKTYVQIGTEMRWNRFYHNSDAFASIEDPVEVNQRTANIFDKLSRQSEENTVLSRLSVTVNASAVMVETGETAWFYDWTYADPEAFTNSAITLIGFSKNRYSRRTPRKRQNRRTNIEDSMQSGSNAIVKIDQKVANRANAKYHDLMKVVITDLVASFVAGKS